MDIRNKNETFLLEKRMLKFLRNFFHRKTKYNWNQPDKSNENKITLFIRKKKYKIKIIF